MLTNPSKKHIINLTVNQALREKNRRRMPVQSKDETMYYQHIGEGLMKEFHTVSLHNIHLI